MPHPLGLQLTCPKLLDDKARRDANHIVAVATFCRDCNEACSILLEAVGPQ
jgi:hypothetical protein